MTNDDHLDETDVAQVIESYRRAGKWGRIKILATVMWYVFNGSLCEDCFKRLYGGLLRVQFGERS